MVQKVARLRQSYCAKMHRNACYAGYKIRGNGNVIRCFFRSLSVPSENWVPFYCENKRDNSQSKLVIQENNHHIILSQLQVLVGNQCILYT